MALNVIGAELTPRLAITSYRWPEVAQMSQIISWLPVNDATFRVKIKCRTNLFSVKEQRLPIF